ncbi:MAG: A24 family peptidase [Candidatus Woesearchaeota archaeon]
MPINTMMLLVVLAVLLAGAYTDIRTREVPDWLNYGLISIGLGVRLIYSLATFEWAYIFEGILGFVAFLVLAYVMFYAGQWGGGDAKMIMGLGAVFGLRLDPSDFTVSFLINVFLVGAVYGLIWSAALAIRNWKSFRREMKRITHSRRIMRARKILIPSAAVLLVIAFFVEDFFLKLLLFALVALYLVTLYLWVAIRAIERSSMYKRVEPEKLTEGDWIVKDIVVDGKRITGPEDLGIDMKQIKKLMKLKKQNKVNKILIKEGIPFVPSFLLAFIATYLFGNLFILVL